MYQVETFTKSVNLFVCTFVIWQFMLQVMSVISSIKCLIGDVCDRSQALFGRKEILPFPLFISFYVLSCFCIVIFH